MYGCMHACIHVCMNVCLCVYAHLCFISLLLEVNEFLQFVKERFSEILIPVDTITKQNVVGKGMYIRIIEKQNCYLWYNKQ